MAAARTTLTPARIVELALDIVDREGLDALNMRRLATEAGVKPMSLYHHFPNKDAILDAVGGVPRGWRETLAEPARRSSPGGGSASGLLFAELHGVVRQHPRALPLISAVVRTPSGRRWMEELMRHPARGRLRPGRGRRALSHARRLHARRRLRRVAEPGDALGAIGPEQPALNWSDYPAMLKVGLRLAVWDHAGEFETASTCSWFHFAAGLGASEATR